MEELGRVKAVYRYPVKSLRAEAPSAVFLDWTGIAGDRQYAFLKAESRSSFPYLTGRDLPALVTYAAEYAEPGNLRRSTLRVAVGDDEYDITDPALSERLSRDVGQPVQLLQIGRGTFDVMPVSVLSTTTLAKVDAQCGRLVDMRRFRPNIVIEMPDGRVQREIEWLGGTLVFGDGPEAAKLHVSVPIDRCMMITIDPDTAERDARILRHVAQDFDNEIGVYCATAAVGTISVGDRVRLLRAGE